ncbi:MAG: 4-hydroxy-tetrahydrodipicolinate reductase [Planctomycetes bacterium]|nr:4-hydroxy-tetrahydrodipicolinate reductase [Planctomycetota bacterium]
MMEIGIHGAAGRVGLRLVDLIIQSSDCKLKLALDRSDHPSLGQDIGQLAGLAKKLNLPLTAELTKKTVDVIIDFSLPTGTMPLLEKCRELKVPLVIGTTGFDEPQISQIKKAGQTIPCLLSPNMSIGANVMFQTAAQLAKKLGPEYDIEVTETHHRFKKDMPSGTAKKLVAAVKAVLPKKNIPTHSLRVGDVVGEHQIVFGTLGERIELKHLVQNRDIFALGAMQVAHWLSRAKPGFYTMEDFLK